MATAPLLTTARYTLSPLTAADRAAFVAYRRVPAVARYQGWTPDYTEADADRLLAAQPGFPPPEDGWIQLAIHDTHGALLGDAAVHSLPDATYELGITLSPSAQGRGVGREVLRALVEMLFSEYAAHRVVARCDARNERVARLLRAVGFRHEGTARECEMFKGEWIDEEAWAMLRRDLD